MALSVRAGTNPAPTQQIEQHPVGAGFALAQMVGGTWKSLRLGKR